MPRFAMALNSLKSKVKYRISRSKGAVFTPRDFFDLSDRDQVGRALRQLVSDETLIKFGQGLYAKAKRSSLTGKLIPVKPLPELAAEALSEKLSVKVVPATDLERYNNGQTTQVPTGRVIAVKGRVSRKMSYDGKSIKYQYVP
ncbi:conserved hypothetical protein [gamma proteobacterium HdN1]|nr:conserved hypothetical protein [gamma proteobacterium HdN1]